MTSTGLIFFYVLVGGASVPRSVAWAFAQERTYLGLQAARHHNNASESNA